MGADHQHMRDEQTNIKAMLRQRKWGGSVRWCGFSLLVGEGFYTQQETLWYPTADEAAEELRRGVRIFHPDFHDDILAGVDEALAEAKSADLIERPL